MRGGVHIRTPPRVSVAPFDAIDTRLSPPELSCHPVTAQARVNSGSCTDRHVLSTSAYFALYTVSAYSAFFEACTALSQPVVLPVGRPSLSREKRCDVTGSLALLTCLLSMLIPLVLQRLGTRTDEDTHSSIVHPALWWLSRSNSHCWGLSIASRLLA